MEAQVSDDVVRLLVSRFGPLTRVGADAWSTAFRFRRGADDLVVRVGEHVDDFELDAEMSRYASDALPIPVVSELDRLTPPHEHLFVCVSTFAPGKPLELVSRAEWRRLVPGVADLLQTMRALRPPDSLGVPTWAETLLSAGGQDGRLGDWQADLRARPNQFAGYQKAMERLFELSALPHVAGVEPTLLHCDLINRNVHVSEGQISGVFDWGCRRWGDHLYELAWFEFWDPWMPNLDAQLLRSELTKRWRESPDLDRFDACLVHIGADHLVYNAVRGEAAEGHALLERMEALDLR